jgi:sulfonate transport system substrate-binding protein
VHQASLSYIKDNPQRAYALAAAELGISVEEVEKMIAWYDFDPTIKPGDVQELKNTQDFLFDNKLLEKKINIEDMIVYPK